MFSFLKKAIRSIETRTPAGNDQPLERELEFCAALDAYMIGYVREQRSRRSVEAVTAERRVVKPGWILRTA
jgi:hypothetical protein